MSTKHDKNQDDLINLSNRLLVDFNGLENLETYWFTHSRREIGNYFIEKYACSYYYAKKIFNNIFGFRDRTHDEIVAIQQKKSYNTNMLRYGRANVGQFGSIEHKLAMINTYGADNPGKIEVIKEKIKQTNLKKYGVECNFQAENFDKSHNYIYELEHFDSSWELALWIYAKDHNEEIIHEPTKLKFIYDNKIHYYTPDFLYQDKLIDIKGSHLYKNGILINTWRDDPQLVSKQRCMEENNVEIWGIEKIKFALDYIKITYGKKYLRQFKIQKKKE